MSANHETEPPTSGGGKKRAHETLEALELQDDVDHDSRKGSTYVGEDSDEGSLATNEEENESTVSELQSSKRAKEDQQRMEAYAIITDMARLSFQIYEEFRRSNDERQRSNDELQRSNDERQRSNEELQRSNEERQRSNKKMESLERIKLEMEIAKVLGDMDRLKELAIEMRKLNDSQLEL